MARWTLFIGVGVLRASRKAYPSKRLSRQSLLGTTVIASRYKLETVGQSPDIRHLIGSWSSAPDLLSLNRICFPSYQIRFPLYQICFRPEQICFGPYPICFRVSKSASDETEFTGAKAISLSLLSFLLTTKSFAVRGKRIWFQG